jgi:hypothetical protein
VRTKNVATATYGQWVIKPNLFSTMTLGNNVPCRITAYGQWASAWALRSNEEKGEAAAPPFIHSTPAAYLQ